MNEHCSERVYDGWGGHRCPRWGVIEEDGGWRCKQHSKAAKEARRAKSEARWAEERAQSEAMWEAKDEQARRAECYPALLEALVSIDFDCEMALKDGGYEGVVPTIHETAQAAIKQAKPEGEGNERTTRTDAGQG